MVQVTDRSDERKFYIEGIFHKTLPPQDNIDSWDYHPDFEGASDIRLASLYLGDLDINNAVPDVMHAMWEGSNIYLKAHVRALLGAKVNLNDHSFFDIIPEHVYKKHLGLKDRICEYVFSTYPRPKNYDYLLDLTRVLDQVRRYGLNINTKGLRSRSVQDRNFVKRLAEASPCCDYNVFGTRTGRLATNPGTFPILNLKKEYRGKSKYNKQLNELYDKETILNKHFFGDHIVTPFGKRIECDDHHALSYIIQSTLGEIVLKKLIEVEHFLRQYKSNIYFTVHDSIVLDFAEEDKSILYEISKIFSDTPLGHFPVSISAGTNYGNMKAVKWRV